MSVNIKTYSDLVNEKKRLQMDLAYHGRLIRKDIADIKEELKPIKAVLAFVSKFISRDRGNPLVTVGVDFIGDILFRNILFARSGFITKHVAPFILKNFSSNLFSRAGASILQRLTSKLHQVTDRFRKNSPERSLNGFHE